jgi:hypothetical protein
MSEQKEEVFDFPDIELEEKDLKLEDYTCNATQAFDAVFQCYSEWRMNANFFVTIQLTSYHSEFAMQL